MKRFLTLLPLVSVTFGALPAAAETIAITNVTVIPISGNESLPGRTVVIADGTVTRVDADARIPEAAIRVDGTGQFLMPALADMHTHLFGYFPSSRPTLPLTPEEPVAISPALTCAARNELFLYLRYGVTTVRDMSGTLATLQWADRVARGEADGPRIHTATPILDGNPPANPNGTAVSFDRPGQVAQALDVLAATRAGGARYEFAKIYERMQPEVYEAVVVEARRLGIPVVGHVPFGVPIEKIIANGQRSIEHLRGYEVDEHHVPTDSLSTERWLTWSHVSDERIETLARLTAGKDIWNVPTLVINQDGMGESAVLELDDPEGPGPYISPTLVGILKAPIFPPDRAKDIFAAQLSTLGKQRKMIAAMARYGDKLMTGTDSPGLGVIPGTSLHREMELLVDYGLSPLQALRAATIEPQRFLKNARAGFVAVGAKGDYLLLTADPLTDIRNTRTISAVVAAGKLWRVPALQAKLAETKACS